MITLRRLWREESVFFEVALNSKDGLKQISALRKRYGDHCLIGAGTAITVELAEKALNAGAMPLNYVKSLKGPFDQGNYVAIGWVCPSNYKSFFAPGYLGVGMASNLMPAEEANGDWEAYAAAVRKIVDDLKKA